MEEFLIDGNKSDSLAEINYPVPLPCVRSTIPRATSTNSLSHSRNISGSTSKKPDGQLSSSRSIFLANPVENRATPCRDLEASTGSFVTFKGTSQSSQTPQQNDHLPASGPVPPGNPETTELQDKDDKPDGASTKSANTKFWKLLLKSRKQSYKNELADLRDAHKDEIKALNLDHREKIMVLEAEKLAHQKTVQELESSNATMQVKLEEKDVIIYQLVGTSQTLQQKYDELKEHYDCASTGSELTDTSALNHQIAATLAAIEERNAVQKELDSAINANRALEADLAIAQNHAQSFELRVRELWEALEQSPNEVANIKGVIELKNKMFSDLEKRAGECFNLLTSLQEKSVQEKKTASQEIAALKAKLRRKEILVAGLQRSKNKFQHQSEVVFAMLLSKVYRDNLINAMEEYFQITIQDNSFLQTEVERQAGEIASCDLKIVLLETAVHEAERSLEEKRKAVSEVELALNTKDVELVMVQMELNSINIDHQADIDRKDELLADTNRRLRETSDEKAELMTKESHAREQWFLKSKDDKIKALEKKCRKLSSSNQRLERDLQTQIDISDANCEATNLSEAELEETRVKLKAVEGQIEQQQEQVREWLGLPTSINVADVIAMKKALGEAQSRIQELESDRQVGQDLAAELPDTLEVDDDDLYGNSDEDRNVKDEEENDDGNWKPGAVF